MNKNIVTISLLTSFLIANENIDDEKLATINKSNASPVANTTINANVNTNTIVNPLQNIEYTQSNNIPLPNNTNNDFADSLANKINSKLDTINKQINEANTIKNSSLNIPVSQMLEEKRLEQFLPIMTGGYEITSKNKKTTLVKKALTMDENGQKYYLDMKNNDFVKGLNSDYLVYKNSESNKTFKSPMALPTSGQEFKVSTTDTINSVTPLAQTQLPPPTPSINPTIVPYNKQTPTPEKVIQELNTIQR